MARPESFMYIVSFWVWGLGGGVYAERHVCMTKNMDRRKERINHGCLGGEARVPEARKMDCQKSLSFSLVRSRTRRGRPRNS